MICMSVSRTELHHGLNSGRFLNVALPHTCQYLLFKTDVTAPRGKFSIDPVHCAVCKVTTQFPNAFSLMLSHFRCWYVALSRVRQPYDHGRLGAIGWVLVLTGVLKCS